MPRRGHIAARLAPTLPTANIPVMVDFGMAHVPQRSGRMVAWDRKISSSPAFNVTT
jgi:hypothetical protein